MKKSKFHSYPPLALITMTRHYQSNRKNSLCCTRTQRKKLTLLCKDSRKPICIQQINENPSSLLKTNYDHKQTTIEPIHQLDAIQQKLHNIVQFKQTNQEDSKRRKTHPKKKASKSKVHERERAINDPNS